MDDLLNRRLLWLADRMEIHDALLRYCRGADRRNHKLIASAFHAEATDTHGIFKGEGNEVIAALIVKQVQTNYSRSMHIVQNHLVEISGDCA